MPLLAEHADTLTERLDEMLNMQEIGENDFTWECEHDHRRTRRILADMGFSPEKIEALIREFKRQGGGCDCEVMLNILCIRDDE